MNTETFQLNFQSVAVIAIVLSVISLIFVGVALIGPFEGQSEKLKQKRLDTKRTFLLTITLLVLATVAIIAFYIGASITSEQKDIIWNVIDSIVSVISAVGTVGAIIAAIWVADRQNKIALFEKKYECYKIIQSLIVWAKQIENVKTNKEVQTAFRIYFDKPDELIKNKSMTEMVTKLKRQETVIVAGAFLFREYDVELLQEIIKDGMDVIVKVAASNTQLPENTLSEEAEQAKQKYIQRCKEFEEKYIDLMEEELKL